MFPHIMPLHCMLEGVPIRPPIDFHAQDTKDILSILCTKKGRGQGDSGRREGEGQRRGSGGSVAAGLERSSSVATLVESTVSGCFELECPACHLVER